LAENKQHTAEFESCIEQVMKQGHEKRNAFAICTDSFKKAGKPIFVGESEKQKLHLFCESFKLEGNKVSGVAIHPKRIFHPEEGMTHVYLREELEKAAPTLVGKPFGIDHVYVLPPPNVITKAWYCPEHEGVCFEGVVDDHIAEQIRKKAFKGLSIELNWLRPGGKVEYVNGVAARNFELTSVHFLKRFPPGDPDAYVKLWEQIKEQLVVAPPLPLDQRVEALERQIQEVLNQISVINAKLEVLTGQSSPSATAQPAQPGASQTTGGMKMKEAEWTTEYINDLPDDAFAVIAPGGEKDEQGKTVPRTLRKLPHHNAQGSLDLDHLRNALARVNQIEPANLQAQAKKHLCAHARSEKAEDLVSEFCGEEQPTQESIKEQQGNQEQEPEKDEHGCIIGKEQWDAENEKCVPIETVKEQQGGERDDYQQFMAQCLESGKSMEECVAAWKQRQGSTETEVKAESLIALRKKLVEVEAQLTKMEKQQKRKAATWKEKYEKLREAVKGAIPPPRIWKSWTPGPQRYVQENLKILRESESW
jgi:hypothetical protein